MQFVGTAYEGQTTADGKRFHGLGCFTFSNGTCYVGGMLDGVFHGFGILFFKRQQKVPPPTKPGVASTNTDATTPAAETENEARLKATAEFVDFFNRGRAAAEPQGMSVTVGAVTGSVELEEEEEDNWGGQYRGVWDHGNHVHGCYVFRDGLVYGGKARKNDSPAEAAAAEAACEAWPYCQCRDHRLWAEHLRNITPVVPYESPLGGTALQEACRLYCEFLGSDSKVNKKGGFHWGDMPMLVPGSCEEEMIPSSFADGRPRGGGDIVGKVYWHGPDAQGTRGAVWEAIQMSTDPLVEEEDPDHNEGDGCDESKQPQAHVVPYPNLQERFPLSLVDGDRSMTPCKPRGGGPVVYCSGAQSSERPASHDPSVPYGVELLRQLFPRKPPAAKKPPAKPKQFGQSSAPTGGSPLKLPVPLVERPVEYVIASDSSNMVSVASLPTVLVRQSQAGAGAADVVKLNACLLPQASGSMVAEYSAAYVQTPLTGVTSSLDGLTNKAAKPMVEEMGSVRMPQVIAGHFRPRYSQLLSEATSSALQGRPLDNAGTAAHVCGSDIPMPSAIHPGRTAVLSEGEPNAEAAAIATALVDDVISANTISNGPLQHTTVMEEGSLFPAVEGIEESAEAIATALVDDVIAANTVSNEPW